MQKVEASTTPHVRATEQRIAIIVPGYQSRPMIESCYAEFLQGVYSFARPAMPWYIRLAADDRTRSHVVENWNPQGIIIWTQDRNLVENLQKSQIPMVLAMDIGIHEGVSKVGLDDQAIGRMAAKHLLERGWTNFGFSGLESQPASEARKHGFVAELEAAGHTCDIYRREEFGFRDDAPPDWAATSKRSQAWLSRLPKPVAVFHWDAFTGQRFTEPALQLGLNIPHDVAYIVGTNDKTLCEVSHPTLSAVDVPYRQVGWEAARRLHQLIETGHCDQDVLLPPRFIEERESTDRISVGDKLVNDAICYIRKHLHEPMNVDTLLTEFCVSRRALETRFRNAIGRTPLQEIHRLRILKAQQYLLRGGYNIEQIAERVGFASARRLRDIFRQYTGKTPSDFAGIPEQSAP
jgi:LacI family transcriptional regulator